MKCDRCAREVPAGKEYKHKGKTLCEDCRLHAGLYPLGHTDSLYKAFYIKDSK